MQARDRVAERRRRLLDAGLEVLGGPVQPTELTVRAVCTEAGISARYFYESFTDKDALVAAVFDRVIADLAATTQAAVAAAPPEEETRSGIANLVRAIADDTRVGRLLFSAQLSHPVLARKRAELGGIFALLSGEHVTTVSRLPHDESIKTVAHFVVGGVGQTLSAWVSGDIRLPQAQLVDRLTRIVDALAVRDLDRT
ncbi:TetR/AcrR family transcriptional regulator [Mycobacterium antarcticum]|uniref:TetR/AcrR family transcriptional regulator n=1 Tax=unclassified Mycolicibacterium TaxID=2636767 RepID=UPI0024E17811|nr:MULTISPECIES: TetR/AcrR family transcriptional regulator [unclassified Mycolicibacterium]